MSYKWPEEPVWGNSLKHFISRLLTYDPQDRLGYAGTSKVLEHPWLSHVDWISMRDRTYEVRSEPSLVPSRHETREALCSTARRPLGDLH